MSAFFKKNWFSISVLFLILIKQRLVTLLPLFPIYSGGGFDDLLMVQMADTLLNFSWPTSSVMLTKGIGFPLFLVLGVWAGISYAALTSLFHAAASLLMVFALRPLIKHKWMMLISFALLLFMPVTYCLDCFQRVYRSSITIWQVLLVMSSLSGMLFRLDKSPRDLLLWSLPGIIGLSWLFHTREDAVWIIPLAVGMFVVSVFFLRFVISWKNREFWVKGMILLLPLVFLMVTIQIISAINYFHNGFWGTTIFTAGSFPRMVRSIYQISWPDSDKISPRLAVSRKQLQSLYQFSPTMTSKRKHIEYVLDNASHSTPPPNPEKEVENGWIFWAMLHWTNENQARDAISFYESVAADLNSAVAHGQLKTRRTMPSALMAPWKSSALPNFKKAFWKCWKRVMNNKKLYIVRHSTQDSLPGIRYMERLTGKTFAHTSDFPCNINRYQKLAAIILKVVCEIYIKLSGLINILGVIGFLVILIKAFYARDILLFKTLLFLSGIFASCCLLFVGIAYTHATGFDAVLPGYLAGGYPIIMVFCLTAFFTAWNILAEVFPGWIIRFHLRTRKS